MRLFKATDLAEAWRKSGILLANYGELWRLLELQRQIWKYGSTGLP